MDRDAPVAEKIGLESREDRVAACVGVDVVGQPGTQEQAGRLHELRSGFPKHGSELCQIGVLAAGRDEGIDRSLVGSQVDAGNLPGAQVFLNVLPQRLEHGFLMFPFDGLVDGFGERAGLVDDDEVPRRFGLRELGRDADADGQDQRQREDADPEAFGLGVLGEFAQRDQKCVSHAGSLEVASAPTSVTKTSCRLGSE